MKIDFNKKYTTLAVYACIVVLFSIVCVYFAIHSDSLAAIVSLIWGIIGPIVFGAVLAYILSPIVNFFERKVFISKECRAARKKAKEAAAAKNITSKDTIERMMFEAAQEKERNRYAEKLNSEKNKKNESVLDRIKRLRRSKRHFGQRALSMLCTYLIIIAVIIAIIWAVIPQIVTSLNSLYNNIRILSSSLPQRIQTYCNKYEWFNALYNTVKDEFDLNNFSSIISRFLSNSLDYVSIITSFLMGVFNQVKNVILVIIFSIYFLAYKEFLARQFGSILDACVKPKGALYIRHIMKEFNLKFGKFLQGQILDSLCIGILSFIIFGICQIPYYSLIAVLVGITNMIPFFGPFIGGIPSAIIIFIADPPKVILFVILIVIMQQIDGNVIVPRILGTTIGLKPVWVITAILLMSGLLGVFGMFFGVPIFAVIYTLISEAINKRLAIKLAAKVVAENESVDFIQFLMEKDEAIDKSLE